MKPLGLLRGLGFETEVSAEAAGSARASGKLAGLRVRLTATASTTIQISASTLSNPLTDYDVMSASSPTN